MPYIERTITTKAPRSAVFAYLADFSNGPEWDPGQAASVARTDGPPHVGLVYDVDVIWGDRILPMEYTVTELDEGNRVVLEGTGSTTTAIDTLTFEDLPDGGTAVTYAADIKLKGLLRVAEPFLGSKFTKLADDAEAGIAEQIRELS